MRQSTLAHCLSGLACLAVLAGCGTSVPSISGPGTPPVATLSGRVHGGEQPVAGATVQLYTVGTNGDGSAATPLLTSTVISDATGNFSLTGLYACTAATQVYLVATGGNPGLSASNPNLALMAALGPCTALTPQTFIAVNELTTVAAVYALQPYMADASHVGSDPSDVVALNAAFTLANQLVNPTTGTVSAASNTAQLNTLADILAACVNSTGGISGDSTLCGKLFSLTTPSGASAPTNTIVALLNLAANPTLNTQLLFQLVSAQAPFQPALASAPLDFGVQQTPSANSATGLQVGPQSLVFSSAIVGAPSTQTVILQNAGTTSITLNSLSFTGANAADFSETNACGGTLAAGANCLLTVSFQPQATGARAATLSLNSTTPDSPQTVEVVGTAANAPNGPHAIISSNAISPYTGAYIDLTLSNTGNAPLSISSISLEDTPFNTQSNNCGSSLPAGSSCIITVHSIATGADQLTVLTNDPNFSSNVLIYGAPNSTDGLLSPSNVLFPDALVGSPQTVTYTYLLNVTANPTITGPQASEFAVTTPSCSRPTLPYYTPPVCTFSVTFTPNAVGLRTARLALDASPNYIPLAGYGITAAPGSALTLSASSLSFNDNPSPQTLTLTNYGNTALSLQSVNIPFLGYPSEYTLATQNSACRATLFAQSVCTISVASLRRTEGGTQAILNIVTSAGSYDVPMSNTLHHVLDLGTTLVGGFYTHTEYPLTEALENYNSSLSGTVASADPQDFGFSGCTTPMRDEPCTAEVDFNPSQVGFRSAGLTTTDTDPVLGTVTREYTLFGTGATSQPAAKVSLSQSGFVNQLGAFTNTLKSTLTFANLGPSTISVSGPSLSGNSSQDFSVTSTSCSAQATGSTVFLPSIPAGVQCTSALALHSTQTGFSSALATVTDSTSGLSFTLPLYLDTTAPPTLSPSSISFAATQVNSISAPVSVSVTRPIGDPITASSSGGVIPVKGSCISGENPCILSFVFAPTTANPYPEITVTDTAYNASASLGVQAIVGVPVTPSSASVSTPTLTFPARPSGSQSIPQTITLSNGGPGSLGISGIGFTGGDGSQFFQTNNCGTLAANSSCTLSVSFAPSGNAGTRSAALTISGAPNSGLPITINVSGTVQ